MDEKIRINKYLSDIGVCSRREADRLTEAGRVTVNGELVSTGMKILPDAEICIDGKPVKKQEKKILLLFHKPKGIVCSTRQQRNEMTVTEYLEACNYVPVQVVVELNEEIIKRDTYDTTVLKDGDVVEILQFMGGGSC